MRLTSDIELDLEAGAILATRAIAHVSHHALLDILSVLEMLLDDASDAWIVGIEDPIVIIIGFETVLVGCEDRDGIVVVLDVILRIVVLIVILGIVQVGED